MCFRIVDYDFLFSCYSLQSLCQLFWVSKEDDKPTYSLMYVFFIQINGVSIRLVFI